MTRLVKGATVDLRFCSTALRASQRSMSRWRTSLSTRPMPRAAPALSMRPVSINLHGVDRAGLADRAAGAAKAGEDAEIDFGETDAGLVVVDGDAVMAGQRQFQPAAEAEAVDAGDDRHLEIFDALEQRMRALERFGQDRKIASWRRIR